MAEGQRFHMIDVGEKAPTRRRALARGRIQMATESFEAIARGTNPKGDVLAQAEVAGIWAGAWVEGMNFSRHAVTVTDGTMSVHVEPKFFTSYMEVSALQLHFAEHFRCIR